MTLIDKNTHPCIKHLIAKSTVEPFWFSLWENTTTSVGILSQTTDFIYANFHFINHIQITQDSGHTSGFVKLQCHVCIKSQAEIIVEDVNGKLK